MADLAGTTVRTVRHYHRLGLLEVPPVVRGRRDYGVEHLARLLRVRWLAEGGLSLRQVAQILDSEADQDTGGAQGGSNREVVLRDLRATRGTIQAQQRSLAEQSARIDELVARVESGQALAPVPEALTRFYDQVESRVAALGGDQLALRTERQMMQVFGSLGLVPASAAAFVEALDETDLQLCAEQMVAFGHLSRMSAHQGRQSARSLAQNSYELACRYKAQAIKVLEDLPNGAMGRTMWRLTHVLTTAGYPHPAHRCFSERLLGLLLADPEFAPAIRRSAGGEVSL